MCMLRPNNHKLLLSTHCVNQKVHFIVTRLDYGTVCNKVMASIAEIYVDFTLLGRLCTTRNFTVRQSDFLRSDMAHYINVY